MGERESARDTEIRKKREKEKGKENEKERKRRDRGRERKKEREIMRKRECDEWGEGRERKSAER